jgi:hypothetical protein
VALARHRVKTSYSRSRSTAHNVISRIRRREEMVKKRQKKEDHAHARKKKAAEIPPENYFMLRDGTAIKSLEDLAMMLDKISDEDFSFHVNEEKNDFANWVMGVFGKKKLADALNALKDKKESQIFLLKHTLSTRGGK